MRGILRPRDGRPFIEELELVNPSRGTGAIFGTPCLYLA
jgi:hypothetical protein